jgi:hypothetical protein
MAGSKANEPGAKEAPALVKFKFSRPWSSDRGYFAPGAEAELPEEIALSLLKENMGDFF